MGRRDGERAGKHEKVEDQGLKGERRWRESMSTLCWKKYTLQLHDVQANASSYWKGHYTKMENSNNNVQEKVYKGILKYV